MILKKEERSPISGNLPLVSIIIPTHNRREKLMRLIKSVVALNYPVNRIEIIVVDDASTDGTQNAIQKRFPMPNLRILRFTKERFVAESKNLGLIRSKGEYIFFVDDDVVLNPDTVSNLVTFMHKNKDVGIAGPIIMYLNNPNIVWCAGIKMNFWTTLGKLIGQNRPYARRSAAIDCDAIPTAFMARRSLAIKIGFDAKLFPIQLEELNFCIKVKKAGYKVMVIPWAKAWHERPPVRARGAPFLRNPSRTYFEARNRIIGYKLWSNSPAQFATSRVFSVIIPFFYIIPIIIFSEERGKMVRVILEGLKDGLAIAKDLNIS